MCTELTPAIARELLDYDPLTGEFTWKPRGREWFCGDRFMNSWNNSFAYKKAGSIKTRKSGCQRSQIKLLNKNRSPHRIAWMIMTGEVPPKEVGYVNRDFTDNRWENIRETRPELRNRNRRLSKSNKLGFFGVYWKKAHRRWVARITSNGRVIYLGSFADIEEAKRVRAKAERSLGFHPGHGSRREVQQEVGADE